MSNEQKEPFFLSMLPFLGLGLLLALAVAWRYLPERENPGANASSSSSSSSSGSGSGSSLSEAAVRRWQTAVVRDVPLAPDRDFTLGPQDAPVTLVEFSDFECPFCQTASSSVKDVVERFGDDVQVVFKNLPLDMACNSAMQQQLHPNACRAAALARCAGRQDASLFWKSHDAMFMAGRLTPAVLDRLPAELDLDPRQLESCMASESTLAEVKADIAEAHALGITSTPTFFINGKQVSDYRDGSLERIVERALELGSASEPAGTP